MPSSLDDEPEQGLGEPASSPDNDFTQDAYDCTSYDVERVVHTGEDPGPAPRAWASTAMKDPARRLISQTADAKANPDAAALLGNEESVGR